MRPRQLGFPPTQHRRGAAANRPRASRPALHRACPGALGPGDPGTGASWNCE
jgi:hypothetical protein